MSEYSGLLFYFESRSQASEFERYISEGWDYSDTISEAGFKVKDNEILIVFDDDDNFTFIILAAKARKVSSRKYRYKFLTSIRIIPPIKLQEIESNIGTGVKHHFKKKITGGSERFSTQTWVSILDAIKMLRPAIGSKIEGVEELRKNRGNNLIRGQRAEQLAEEKDAVLLSLKLAGFDNRILKEWTPSPQHAPFLSGLPQVRLSEDAMISHDMGVFDNWKKTGEYQVGAVAFENDKEKVTILNVNRRNLEHAIGVDLVYYHHKHKTYIFVQYKRMEKESQHGDFAYRPIDKSYLVEIERMKKFEIWRKTVTDSLAGKPKGYRFNNDIFYFKLCPASSFNPEGNEMIRGMYIPLEFWNSLLQSEESTGPKDGKFLTYDVVERYFTNTAFANLIQSGLVGSRLADSKSIDEMVKMSLSEGKSVFLTKVESLLTDRNQKNNIAP